MRTFSELTESFIYDQLCELRAQRVPATVVALNRVNEERRPFPDVQITGQYGRWNAVRLWHRAAVRLKLRRADELPPRGLKTVLRKVDPGVIHAHFGPAGVMIAPAARSLGIPLLVSFYGHDASRLAARALWRERYRRLWGQVAGAIALSDEMAARLSELGCPAGKISRVHVGKRMSDYEFVPRTGPVRRLLSVGRLVEKKGHIDLLCAVKNLLDVGRDISLTIAGAGPLLPELTSFVEHQGMAERVSIVNVMGYDAIVRLLRAADAFVLCSKTARDGDEEGTPTVLLEAQAAGLPCVSTWHAGIPETIPEANHWLLAQPGDVASITDRLLALLDSAPSTLGAVCERGRRKVEEEFNIETEARTLARLYETVTLR